MITRILLKVELFENESYNADDKEQKQQEDKDINETNDKLVDQVTVKDYWLTRARLKRKIKAPIRLGYANQIAML